MNKEAEKMELSILRILPARTHLKSVSPPWHINVTLAWAAEASADAARGARCVCRAAATHSAALASLVLKPDRAPGSSCSPRPTGE